MQSFSWFTIIILCNVIHVLSCKIFSGVKRLKLAIALENLFNVSVCICAHVVISVNIHYSCSDLSRLTRMRHLEKSHKLKHHFVTSDWVSDSIDCEFLKNERLYEPKTS